MWCPGNKRTAIIAPGSSENFFQTEQFTRDFEVEHEIYTPQNS